MSKKEKARRQKVVTLNHGQKQKYIESHLFNELRWLLGAAQEWSIQEQLSLGIVGYDVIVYAMDSAFLHARSLFEFFVCGPTKNHYSCKQFVGDVLKSEKYKNWNEPLHANLMHARDRSKTEQLEGFRGEMKPLNKMPVDFAEEILGLWEKFEENLLGSRSQGDRELGRLAQQKRKAAIDCAKCVIDSEVTRQHAELKHEQLKPVFPF